MLAITRLLKSFMHGKRGVSNVLVVMLSLIIIVMIVSNIILWSYQMNQLDWEKMQEKIELTSVERLRNSSWFTSANEYAVGNGSKTSGTYMDTWAVDDVAETFREETTSSHFSGSHPSTYNLLGETKYASGSLNDLRSSDDVYMQFHSYGTATSPLTYNPSSFTPLGGTTLVSGNTTDLQGNDDVSMTFRSYASSYSYQQVTFVSAGTGSAGTTSNPTPTYPTGLQVNDLILLQVTVRDTTNTPVTPANFTLLFGPDSTGTGRQWIYYKFSDGTESGTITITIGGSACKIARMYAFRNVALSNFVEGANYTTGTSATIYAPSVTTTTPSALAVAFVFINYNNQVGSFTGETGGDWIEAVAEYRTGVGGRGCIQLQTAVMSNPRTISGGSYTMSRADPWGVRAFALKPNPIPNEYTVEVEFTGTSNTYDWTELTWTIDSAWTAANVSVTLQLYNYTLGDYSPSGDGFISYTSSPIPDAYETRSKSITVNPTHFRDANGHWKIKIRGVKATSTQFDFKCDWIEFKCTCYSQYACEVEFTGTASNNSWTQFAWIIESSFTMDDVTVTFQLYNYTARAYSTSGEGYITDTIGIADEIKSQTIASLTDFINATSGEWKVKIMAVKADWTPFDLKLDWIELEFEMRGDCSLSVIGEFVLDLSTYPPANISSIEIQIRFKASDTAESWFLKAYNWTSGQFSDVGFNSTSGFTPSTEFEFYTLNLADSWQNYVNNENGTVKIIFYDSSPDNTPTTINIDFLGVRILLNGASFKIFNGGAVTAHIVGIWIINSTYHERYDVNIFVNSGEELNYIRMDMRLSENFTIKFVTERGNIAIYSSR